ncbi:hypothetical protein PHMEG_00037617 [Phytophthora megakarya]|uniref:Uncharacterized protein n=1 Tax=Phytophthora megakarya TaxID=4795 RepID=A0A225UJE4_9STRA|nr:hypothetical protein PHMEG_00037617 [Phytophthora megakarya]
MASTAATSQPSIWTTQLQHLWDFQCIADRGISFACRSEEAQALLGNTQLKICCSLVMIRKYSKNDKLYFVDLRYLPPVPQTRPVMITSTQGHDQINSHDRTEYFNRTECPSVLTICDRVAVREIYFDPDNQDEKSRFVQHRTARFNRTTHPSLRKKNHGANGSAASARTATTTNRTGTALSTTARTDSTTGSDPDDSVHTSALVRREMTTLPGQNDPLRSTARHKILRTHLRSVHDISQNLGSSWDLLQWKSRNGK